MDLAEEEERQKKMRIDIVEEYLEDRRFFSRIIGTVIRAAEPLGRAMMSKFSKAKIPNDSIYVLELEEGKKKDYKAAMK